MSRRLLDQAGVPWLQRGWEPEPPRPELRMAYDFPLRRDMIVRLVLPVRLTRADADRINKFVAVLAFQGLDEAAAP